MVSVLPTRPALLPSQDVELTVAGDVARLDGTTPSIEDRDDLIDAAARLTGVSVVVDALRVRELGPFLRPDDELAADVAGLLAHLPTMDTSGLRARVRHGAVVLGGRIAYSFQRDTVLGLIAALPGVTDVVDAVAVPRASATRG